MIGQRSAVLLLLFFGLSLGAEAADKPVLSSNIEPVLEGMRKELADPSLPVEERLGIIAALGGWATAQARALLVATLKDPAPELRAAAAQALGWAGNREAIGALRDVVSVPGEVPDVRALATRSLGIIGDASVRPFVIATAQDSDPWVREAALWGLSLGALVDPADRTHYLIRVAEDRALDPQTRCDAIRALAGVKEDRVVEALMRLLEHEPRIRVALPPTRATQNQVMMLRHAQARDVPAWAAGSLGVLDARRAVPLLLRSAEDPNDYFLRLQSLQWLAAWSIPEAGPVFVRRLEDPLPDIRLTALIGLERRADRTVIGPILARLSDPAGGVRAQAVRTVAALGDATARPSLEAMQQSETDVNVRAALEEALVRLPR